MGKKMSKAPKIFHVNWFRTDAEGDFMWPGFGDNFRVLDWIIKRCEGAVDAEETAIGFVPKAEDICLEDLHYDISPARKFDIFALRELLTIDKDAWKADLPSIEEFYGTIGDRLPRELRQNLDILEKNLDA